VRKRKQGNILRTLKTQYKVKCVFGVMTLSWLRYEYDILLNMTINNVKRFEVRKIIG
jgi:hypothetical protein